MSTCNFSYDNILIVLPSFYNEEEDYFDDFYFEETKDSIQNKLQNIGYTACSSTESRYNRNYEGLCIASKSLENKDGYVYFNIEVVIRDGYYSGQNIEYVIVDDIDDIKINKTMQKKIDSLINRTKKILLSFGEEYICTARFSNGEAMYSKKAKLSSKNK